MIHIQPALLSDSSAIAKLHAESWRQNYRGILSDVFLENEAEREREKIWNHRLMFPSDNQIVRLAFHEEKLAGFFCLILDDDPYFGSLVDNLHVASSFQNSGIGTLLIKECAKTICERSNNNKMYLWVYELNHNAIRFYERLGGLKSEVVEKETVDGSNAKTFRFIWKDITHLVK